MVKLFYLIFAILLAKSVISFGADEEENICPPNPGPGQYLFPHENCTLFYVCEDGNLTIMECPDGLYYNPRIKVCDYPFNVPECVGGTRPPYFTTPMPETEAPPTTPEAPPPTPTEPPAPTTTEQVETTTTESGGDWIVIQRRGSQLAEGEPRQSFDQGWDAYTNGFGDQNKDFWLGLEEIAQLTANGNYELSVEVRNFTGSSTFAHYRVFQLDRLDSYRLNVSGFSGDAFDSLTAVHNGMKFSTPDRDDFYYCASGYGAGWWYNDCFTSNLNGIYHSSPTDECSAVRWEPAPDSCISGLPSLSFSEMRIRRRWD